MVVDAIDADWERQGVRLSIFIRDGPSCEAKAATEAVKNEFPAILFDKMGVDSWAPVESSKLNEHEKGSIMEYLVVRLYETKGGNARLAELVLACLIQSLIWFAIYDIRRKRSLVPFLAISAQAVRLKRNVIRPYTQMLCR